MRIHKWNFLLSLFFVVLVLYSVWYLIADRSLYYAVPVRDLVLMGLAIFRFTRLFTYDVITQFIRDWFVGARKDSFRHTLGALLDCPWCTGLWFSWFVVFFYFAAPVVAWPIILIMALASGASFFQLIANWVGWSAELKKMETKSFEQLP